MLNILVPIAGKGRRFIEAGYKLPKPLIPINGKPMLYIVINNIKPNIEHKFIFLVLKEHIINYGIENYLKNCVSNCEIIVVDKVTEGAACTVLLAKEFINNDNPLMIANGDQWVDIDINDYLKYMEVSNSDGLIMTMWADHPKWSYVRINESGKITEVVEKEVVSNEATVGIYNYKKGIFFVEAAEKMIAENLRVNNEFYVAPAYNKMIEKGMRISIYNIGKEYDGMYGLGIPADVVKFENLIISKKATNFL